MQTDALDHALARIDERHRHPAPRDPRRRH
jgi:hypothetical protein